MRAGHHPDPIYVWITVGLSIAALLALGAVAAFGLI